MFKWRIILSNFASMDASRSSVLMLEEEELTAFGVEETAGVDLAGVDAAGAPPAASCFLAAASRFFRIISANPPPYIYDGMSVSTEISIYYNVSRTHTFGAPPPPPIMALSCPATPPEAAGFAAAGAELPPRDDDPPPEPTTLPALGATLLSTVVVFFNFAPPYMMKYFSHTTSHLVISMITCIAPSNPPAIGLGREPAAGVAAAGAAAGLGAAAAFGGAGLSHVVS